MMQQRDRLYELDKPGLPPQAARPAPAAGLPQGWIGLDDCNLSPLPGHVLEIPHVLLHPEVGVALIDLAPGETLGAEEAFRARLEAARFAAIFPGTLPVAHLQLAPEEMGQLGEVLRQAFAALPSINLPGGDGWVSVVRRALAPRMPGRGPMQMPGERRAPPPMLTREVAAQRAGLAAAPLPPAAPAGGTRWPSIPVALGLAGLAAAASAAAVLWSGTSSTVAPVPVATAPERSGAAPGPAAAAAGGGTPARSAAPTTPLPVAPAPVTPAPGQVAATLIPVPRDRTAPPPAPTPAPPAAAATAPGPRLMVRAAANLRANPSNTAPIIRTIPQGEVLREFSRSPDGWVEVGDTQPRGWVFSKLLVPPKP